MPGLRSMRKQIVSSKDVGPGSRNGKVDLGKITETKLYDTTVAL